MSTGYWRALATLKLWEENTRAVAQGKAREVEATARELLRRTDFSPEAEARSKAACAERAAAAVAQGLYREVPETA